MHHQCSLARAACTARNAYDPFRALTSALLAGTNDAALRPPVRRVPPYVVHQRAIVPQRRPFSSDQRAAREAPAAVEVGDGDDGASKKSQQQQKLQRKGTFAGYEALMGTLGNATSPEQGTAEATTLARKTMSSEYYDRPTNRSDGKSGRSWRLGPYQRKGSRDGDVAHIRPADFDDRRKRRDTRAETAGRSAKTDGRRDGTRPNRSDRTHGREIGDLGQDSRTPRAAPQFTLDSAFNAYDPYHSKDDWRARMHTIGEQANKLAQQKPTLSTEEFAVMKSRMTYRGIPIAAEKPSVAHQAPFPWTAAFGESAGMAILNIEVNSFATYMRLTNAERAARQSVKKEMVGFVKAQVGGDARVTLFGSEVTGLSSATSDLDFRLHARTEPDSPMIQQGKKESEFTLKTMRKLADCMKNSPDWIATVLRHARYPIINAQHRKTGIDVQIVSSPSTEPQQQATLHYLERIPNLKQLYFVIKSMFGMRGLVDVFNGGAGSYGLLMMLVASLTRRGADYTSAEPGAQLLQFLDFYCEHDYHQNGIAIAPPMSGSSGQTTLFRKHRSNAIPRANYIRAAYARDDPVRAGQWSIGQRRPFQPYLPCIQDPANPLNDLGRKMNAIKHIVTTLKQVREAVRGNLESAEKRRLDEGASLLEPAVGRCHEIYFERRRRVEEYGLGIIRRHWEKKQAKEQEKQQQEFQPVETAWAG